MELPREIVLHPRAEFPPDFAPRARALAARLARTRAQAESYARRFERGGGDDLLGLRAYRPGDDPRHVDWTASARAAAPLVRLWRRPRGGLEEIVLDASASMAVGPPGKFAAAACSAAAWALCAVRAGARARLVVLPHGLRFDLHAPEPFPALVAALAGIEARGALEPARGAFGRCDRATWIGDLAGSAPDDLARAAPRGVPYAVLQVLAPHEIAPRLEGPVRLVDPETGAHLDAAPAALAAHARALEAARAAWARALAARGGRFARAASDEPFEAACARLAGP